MNVDAKADVWAVLHDAEAPALDTCRSWLALQCGLVPGTRAGLLMLNQAAGLAPIAAWPDAEASTPLTRLAERAALEQRTVVAWGRAGDAVLMQVAQPLGPEGAAYGAVALAVASGGIDQADPEGTARRLRASAGWLEAMGIRESARANLRQLQAAQTTLHHAAIAMDILAVVGEHTRLTPAAMALVNELATRLACARVSLGVVRGGRVRLAALSHTATFQRASRMVDAIEDAMEEALVQGGTVAHPAIDEVPLIAIVHRDLAATHGAALSVVLAGPRGPAGVLTFERAAPFDPATAQLATAIAALAGPIVALQTHAHRLVAGRAIDGTAHGIGLVLGPRRPALKLATLAAAAGLAALAFLPGTHRVSARATIEGAVQLAAVAPFDGYIRTAPARAGDTVHQGDVLATLDDRDLILERVKAWAEREKLRQRFQEALSKHDRPQTAMIAAQIDQAQATLTLAEDKLARARVTAPMDGVVVSGDLSQMLGSPTERGKTLFELAPLDQFRLALQVEEQDIGWVHPGQTGTLALASTPGTRLPFTITHRTPVATTDDSRNVFRIEASLDTPTLQRGLRPGMEGIAKVEIGQARLLWVWTHPMLDAIRLFAWKWLP